MVKSLRIFVACGVMDQNFKCIFQAGNKSHNRVMELFNKSICIRIMESLNIRANNYIAQWFSIFLSNGMFAKLLFKLVLQKGNISTGENSKHRKEHIGKTRPPS